MVGMFEAPHLLRYGLAFALAATAMLPAAARAQVLEIDGEGNTSVLTGAGAGGSGESAPFSSEPLATPPAALTALTAALAPQAYAQSLVRAAEFAGISPALLEAVIWQESRWRPQALSPAGAMGLGQLMPGTARALGVNPRDPDANLLGAAVYLRQQLDRFDNDLERALAAYNAGPGRVERARGIPDISETRAYVTAILGRLAAQAGPV